MEQNSLSTDEFFIISEFLVDANDIKSLLLINTNSNQVRILYIPLKTKSCFKIIIFGKINMKEN